MPTVTLEVVESTTQLVVTNTSTDVNVTETYADLTLGNSGPQGIKGDAGANGPTGPSGVIAVTSPITNSGTSTSATIGIDQTALTLAQSQVTDLTTNLAAKVDSSTLTGFSNQSTSAADTISRAIAHANIATVSGTLYFIFFTPSQNVTATQVTMATNTTASSSLTLARMGLYTFDGTTATLVARTASDTTLFNATSTSFTRSFDTTGGYPASYTLTAGTRYALGVIQVGTTAASFAGVTGNGLLTSLAPRTVGSVSGQADLLTTRNTFSVAGQLLFGRFS